MEYGRIIKRALEITWRHKVLWIFGIAAALFGGTNGGGSSGPRGGVPMQYTVGSGDVARWRHTMPFGPRLPFGPSGPYLDWQALIPILLGILALVLFLVLVMAIVGLIVRYTSLGALAGMVDEIEDSERTTFRSGLNRGWGRFLRLFAIDLLLGLGVFVALIPFFLLILLGVAFAVGPAVLLASGGKAMVALGIVWGVGVGLGLVFLIILVAVALGACVVLIRELAFRACVLDTQGVFDSFRAAFAMLRAHLRETVLMWLLLFGINLAVGLIALPLMLMAMGGLVGPAFLVFGVTKSLPAAVVAAVPFLLFIIIGAVCLSGIYLTFQSSVWTLTYRELRGKQVLAEAV